MRLFTGIALPEAVVSHIAETINRLRGTAPIQWSRASNLHITTKFLGEVPEDRVEELKRALAAIPVPSAFDIEIAGFGWFPNPDRPRVLWCGIRAPDALGELAAATDAACVPFGIEPEKRAFSPHLTIARVKDPTVPLTETKRAIASLPSVDFGRFRAGMFHLYQSKTNPSGSVYTRLADYSLA